MVEGVSDYDLVPLHLPEKKKKNKKRLLRALGYFFVHLSKVLDDLFFLGAVGNFSNSWYNSMAMAFLGRFL